MHSLELASLFYVKESANTNCKLIGFIDHVKQSNLIDAIFQSTPKSSERPTSFVVVSGANFATGSSGPPGPACRST